MLETLIVSNNKLGSLRRVEQLPNLRAILAQNNQIAHLHPELQDMYCLDTLNLCGNPVVNTCPDLARIENNQDAVAAALAKHFSGGGLASGLPSMSMASLGAFNDPPARPMSSAQPGAFAQQQPKISPYGQNPYGNSKPAQGGVKVSQLLSQGSNPKLAYQESNSSQESAEDQLRSKIRELELENGKLKQGGVTAEDKNWMSSGFGGAQTTGQNFYKSGGTTRPAQGGFGGQPLSMERPMTAAGGNKVREMENQLRDEQRAKKRLVDEVEALKKELHKQGFA